LRLLHPGRIVLEQSAGKKANSKAAIKDAVRRKLRQSYPMFVAKMPNPPSLEEFLAKAEERLADIQPSSESAASAVKEFVFAEDRMVELAKLLGIPDGLAINSYRYLINGEGSPGSFTLVHAGGERSIRME
jgi:hypothetical protein